MKKNPFWETTNYKASFEAVMHRLVEAAPHHKLDNGECAMMCQGCADPLDALIRQRDALALQRKGYEDGFTSQLEQLAAIETQSIASYEKVTGDTLGSRGGDTNVRILCIEEVALQAKAKLDSILKLAKQHVGHQEDDGETCSDDCTGCKDPIGQLVKSQRELMDQVAVYNSIPEYDALVEDVVRLRQQVLDITKMYDALKANVEAGVAEMRRYVEANGFEWQEGETPVFNVTTALGLMGGTIEQFSKEWRELSAQNMINEGAMNALTQRIVKPALDRMREDIQYLSFLAVRNNEITLSRFREVNEFKSMEMAREAYAALSSEHGRGFYPEMEAKVWELAMDLLGKEEIGKYDDALKVVAAMHSAVTSMISFQTDLRSAQLLDKMAQLEEVKDGAYSERNKLVALLSAIFPASLERHVDKPGEVWEDDWRWIVFVDLPDGQATWHIHDSELPNFGHLKRNTGRTYDDHSTEEKYRRVASSIKGLVSSVSNVIWRVQQ